MRRLPYRLMQFPQIFLPVEPDREFDSLFRGYGLALLFVVSVHAAVWLWTRREPAETPVVIPPMVDVELIAAPKPSVAGAAAPAASVPPAAAKPVPKKAAAAPKPKPKPAPKPAETPQPVREPAPAKPIEEAESGRVMPKPVPAPATAAGETSSPRSSSPPREAGPAGSGKAGGGSGPAVTPAHDAAYLHNPKPRYPAIAIARNWEGLVRLRVYVLPNGTPGQVVLQQSSGHGALDDAALEVVRGWRFVPAKRGEQAIASWVVVPLVFKLDSGR